MAGDLRTAVLDGPSAQLGDLLYGPATVLILEGTSADAASTGLAAWREVLTSNLGPLLGAPAGGGAMAAFGASDLVVEDLDLDGTPVIRVRFGPVGDVAFAVVGADLVVAQPLAAMERVISAAASSVSTEAEGAGFAAVEEVADRPWIGFAYANARASLEATADALEASAQPVAFALSAGIAAALDESRTSARESLQGFGSGGFGDDGFGPQVLDDDAAWQTLELGEMTTPPAALDGVAYGALDAATPTFLPFEDPYDFYVLPELVPGTVVTIVLTSDAFDTYLDLVDPATGLILLSNDDAGGFDRSELSFVADGRDLWVGVSRFGIGEGPYELTISVASDEKEDAPTDNGPSEEAAAPATAPTLADLLPAAELPARLVRELADRAGWFTHVVRVDGGVLVDEMRWQIRW
jgi:hypothetical protein